jgi:hypothetical protein
VVWARSYDRWWLLAVKSPRTSVEFVSANGQIEIEVCSVYESYPMDEQSLRWGWWRAAASANEWAWHSPKQSFWNTAGFGWTSGERMASMHVEAFYLPWWFIWLVTVPPSVWFSRQAYGRWRAFRQARQSRIAILLGLCPNCGYDLRASPEHCPECGHPVPAKS